VDTVGVLKPDDTVEIRQVKTGVRIGMLWEIESGLAPGDRVIVEGLQKVRPGMKVTPSLVPVDESAPPGVPTAAGE
jgi:membrane fusion protein (multidrug efflux system)